MGVGVSHDDSVIIIAAEQGVHDGPVYSWATGDWGDADVDGV